MNAYGKTGLVLLVLILAAGCAGRMQRPVVSSQIECTFETDIPRPMSGNYLMYLPEQYDRSQKRWPLILFLHGSGQRGSNLQAVKKHGLPKEVETKRDFPFIVISPQCPNGREWSSEYLGELLDDIISHYRVDPDRVYLTGMSMGGYGVWDLASRYPEKFAAIAPVCGGGNSARAARLRGVPAWVFHGARDNEVPLAEAQAMVNALKRAGGTVKFTIYPKAGHKCWEETYRNPELYAWFLQHHRRSGSFSGLTGSGPGGN
jgi:predicted peptidase